jgi:hypothetical protein
MSRPVVYLLHFSDRLGSDHPRGGAGHYLGVALDGDVTRRLRQHQLGVGAAITRACAEQGIALFVTRTWPGGRRVERRLKAQHNGPRLCPACVPASFEVSS